ncbi:hypothetical protein U1Q18_018727 [Sarracenia purpurea var. burkii]
MFSESGFDTSNFQVSNMLHKTHYDILGVRDGANYEEIRTSYRSAILDSHPDKLQKTPKTCVPELDNRFLEVQRAWEVLGNSKSRAIYDSELWASRHEFVAAEDVGLDDLMVQSARDEVFELFYQCRCGDFFSIDSSELEEMGYLFLRDGSKISLCMSDADASPSSSVLLSCGSCSLQVRLLIHSESKLKNDPYVI